MTSINSACFIFCDYKMIEKIAKNRPCKYTIYIYMVSIKINFKFINDI